MMLNIMNLLKHYLKKATTLILKEENGRIFKHR